MPFVLREGFAEGGSDLSTAGGAPAAAAFEILVDAVLLQEPVALAGVTGEHFQLQVERGGDIEDELRLDGAAEPIGRFDGIDEVQMRDVIGRGSGLPLASRIVRDAGVEAGVAEQLASHLVVRHVIDRRGGEDDVGADSAQDFGDSAASVVVVRDAQVAKLQAEVIGSEQIGGGFRFGSADGGDFVAALFG